MSATPRRTLVRIDPTDYRESVERRRFDCAHLPECEDTWVRTNGIHTAQASCLLGCRGYEQRAFAGRLSWSAER